MIYFFLNSINYRIYCTDNFPTFLIEVWPTIKHSNINYRYNTVPVNSLSNRAQTIRH